MGSAAAQKIRETCSASVHCVTQDREKLQTLPLSLCSGVTNLLFWSRIRKVEIEAISRLPLTHLCMSINDMPRIPEVAGAFSQVTHLRHPNFLGESVLPLDHFPSLTHLAFRVLNFTISPLVFDKVPKLQILICYCLERDITPEAFVLKFNPDKDDPQIICIVCAFGLIDDWLAYVINGRGVWGVADEAVEMRKRLAEQDGGTNEPSDTLR